MIKTTVPLAIVMRDRNYAEAVMRGLALAWREFRVRCEAVPGPGENAGGACRCGEPAAAVLTDGETFGEASDRYPEVPLFVIGDPFDCGREDVFFLSPFFGARELGAEILGTLGWERRAAGENGCFCVVLTATAGGVGLSSLAASLARTVKSLRSGPVIYLSYEPYPGGWMLFRGVDNGRTVEDFLFRLGSPYGKPDPDAYLREEVGGVKFFASNGTYNELLGLSCGEEDAFLDAVFRAAKDGTVIVDAPVPDPAAIASVLNAAHVLVLVGDGSEETELRNALLEARFAEMFEFRSVLRAVNESRPGKPLRAVVGNGDTVLPYDPESMEPNGICLEKAFGSGVRELAEELERIRRGEADGRGRRDRAAEDERGGRAFVR